MTEKIEQGYEAVKAWAVVRTNVEVKWNERKIRKMDAPGRVMDMAMDTHREIYEEIENGYFFAKEEAYDTCEKCHNAYYHFRGNGGEYLNATEYWVAEGTVSIERDEDGEITDTYDWDPDGDLDITETQENDWKEFWDSEFSEEEE